MKPGCSQQKSRALRTEGKNNQSQKGVNSQRFDVLYKTLFRSMRMYLWETLVKSYDIPAANSEGSSLAFTQYVTEFYNSHFRPFTQSAD